ncbi:MBL fold metallo-hydrolase [Hamadaea tsunoensis]|uniref:MBL fold metallo-hydrolase n=1 Tax=Hamadaea tsunoensis TaxID=53368 RepID=UPI00048902A4|nr:MBL fold metallo-hydrolase [Hamadaea tsunoensis]
MRITKLGHACVRVEKDDRVLVVDPGIFTPEAEALAGVDVVLVTHEHADHVDDDRLAAAQAADPRLRIFAPQGVADAFPALRVEPVGHGESFSAAGFTVDVYGHRHALSHPDVTPCANSGFLIDGEVFHPGDSYTVPDRRVPTLLVPCDAPWLKLPEMVEYLRRMEPARAYTIHDAYVSDIGMDIVASWLEDEAELLKADIRVFRRGDTVEV